jgi:hypothetical protein
MSMVTNIAIDWREAEMDLLQKRIKACTSVDYCEKLSRQLLRLYNQTHNNKEQALKPAAPEEPKPVLPLEEPKQILTMEERATKALARIAHLQQTSPSGVWVEVLTCPRCSYETLIHKNTPYDSYGDCWTCGYEYEQAPDSDDSDYGYGM